MGNPYQDLKMPDRTPERNVAQQMLLHTAELVRDALQRFYDAAGDAQTWFELVPYLTHQMKRVSFQSKAALAQLAALAAEGAHGN